MKWYVGLMVIVFTAGFIAGINVAILHPPSPLYDVAWWKVAGAVVATAFFAVMYYRWRKKQQ